MKSPQGRVAHQVLCSAVYTVTAETDRYPNNMHRACLEHALLVMCCECARETHTGTERGIGERECVRARLRVFVSVYVPECLCACLCAHVRVEFVCVHTHTFVFHVWIYIVLTGGKGGYRDH
jgi:hypothetical protein